jgi:hypothetical protein
MKLSSSDNNNYALRSHLLSAADLIIVNTSLYVGALEITALDN